MPITDLPLAEQALWDAIAEVMADQVEDEPQPDIDAFLALLADQA